MIPLPAVRPLFIAPMFELTRSMLRKSTTPVLFEALQDGTIRLINASGVVATGRASEAKVAWGRQRATMEITISGQIHVLSVVGDVKSANETPAMSIYLRWSEDRTNQFAQQWRRGRKGITVHGDEGYATLGAWRDLFSNLGVTTLVKR